MTEQDLDTVKGLIRSNACPINLAMLAEFDTWALTNPFVAKKPKY